MNVVVFSLSIKKERNFEFLSIALEREERGNKEKKRGDTNFMAEGGTGGIAR